jgi:hypothetical protein
MNLELFHVHCGNFELDIIVQDDIDIVTVLETLFSPRQIVNVTAKIKKLCENLIPRLSPLIVLSFLIPMFHTLPHATEIKIAAAHGTCGLGRRHVPLTNTRVTECVTTNQLAPSVRIVAHRALHRFLPLQFRNLKPQPPS